MRRAPLPHIRLVPHLGIGYALGFYCLYAGHFHSVHFLFFFLYSNNLVCKYLAVRLEWVDCVTTKLLITGLREIKSCLYFASHLTSMPVGTLNTFRVRESLNLAGGGGGSIEIVGLFNILYWCAVTDWSFNSCKSCNAMKINYWKPILIVKYYASMRSTFGCKMAQKVK